MSYSLYLDTANRDSKKIKLLKDEEVIDEVESPGDEISEILDILKRNNLDIKDIESVNVNKGPGSFTGLKIGVTIENIFNYSRGKIRTWSDLALPRYGKEPNISKPKDDKIRYAP